MEPGLEHIVFLEKDSVHATVRRPVFPHAWTEYAKTSPDEVFERVKDATIVIANKVILKGDLLARLPRLRLIAVAATGTDNIDLAWCCEHKLPVTNIRGYAAKTVPEHVFMLLLALRRQLPAYRADVAAGEWQRSSAFCFFAHPIRDLSGSTLGLIGRGSLGQGVARLAETFGMRVLWGERKGATIVRPGYVSFETLLAESDALSLHCPLDERTHGMIGEPELRAMKTDAILINTARGGLVDEGALVRALREGWIAGAGFDVLSSEPPRDGNPLLVAELPNLIVTPHVAWASGQAMQALADQLIDNMEAFVRGEERNRVV
jgi:glycerate dehydrogenase